MATSKTGDKVTHTLLRSILCVLVVDQWVPGADEVVQVTVFHTGPDNTVVTETFPSHLRDPEPPRTCGGWNPPVLRLGR